MTTHQAALDAIAQQRAVIAAGTPGRWQHGEDVDSGDRFVYDARWTELAEVAEWSTGLGNPSLIVAAVNAYPLLLDLAEAVLLLAEGREEDSNNDHMTGCDDNEDCARCCADDARRAVLRALGIEAGE